MIKLYKFIKLDLSIVLSVVLFLSACGGSGGSGTNDSGSAGGGVTQNPSADIVVLHGSVGDGPIIGANVKVFNKDGDLVGEQTSDNTASYELSVRVNRGAYPLILEATGGQDVVTGGQPDFILNSIVLSPAGKRRVNINPFSTMVVQLATGMIGGLTAENLAVAKQIVLQQMNFGLDQAVMPDPVSSSIDAKNIAVIVRSSEALGEMVRRTRDILQVAKPNITADDVVSTLAADLLDGVIDGDGSVNADARVAAIANIASAQVLSEVMTGALHVNNADASAAMDNAVLVSVPTADTMTSVNDLPIVSEMLMQTRVALLAAQTIDLNPTLVEAGNSLVNIQPGSQSVNIAAVIPADISSVLSSTLSSITVASDSSLELVNSVVRQGGEVSGNINTAPTISGTPVTKVTEGALYTFVPTANDAEKNTLNFSITNLPGWASFSAATGALSGTPTGQDVGLWSGIVISVSDGAEKTSLPKFSIAVDSLPNSAPTISGTPAKTVNEGEVYNFIPIANDADGDTLSFSASNLPSWASFNSRTGVLTGTPGSANVGMTSNIVISVSDGVDSASLPAFSINVTAAATSTGTATLSWMPPTENTDGSVLTDLAGYKIYYGTTPGNYTSVITIDNPGITTYVVENLPGGSTYFFVITSVTSSGLESEFSTVGSKTIL